MTGKDVLQDQPSAASDVIIAMAENNWVSFEKALANSPIPKRTQNALRRKVRLLYAPLLGAIIDLSRESFVKEMRARRMKIIEGMTDAKIHEAPLKDSAMAAKQLQEMEHLILGEATSIVSIEDRRKLEELTTLLLAEAHRRGVETLVPQEDGSYAVHRIQNGDMA